jgi:hypothetical protein
MVVFGLAPNTAYLKSVLGNYSEKIKQPSFPYVTNSNPIVDQVERKKVKPFNRNFAYKLLNDGTLEISHISLESVLDLYKINKQILNFHKYIRAQLLKKHIEHTC